MLSVKYGADVPTKIAQILEHHARHTGLSLEAIETIGSSLDFVEAFIVAAEDGRGQEYAQKLGLAPPAGKIATARWQAAKLFGA